MNKTPYVQLLLQAKALADATRLGILGVLAEQELNVGELVAVLGMGQSRISRHLKILVDAGLLTCTRSGAWALYRVPDPAPGLLAAALSDLAQDPEIQAYRQRAAAVLVERRRMAVGFFDAVAHEWKALSQEILGDFDLDAVILEMVRGAEVVADLGCGPGFLLERLAGLGICAVGVDHSPRMLEAAGRRVQGLPGVSLRLGDLEHLPLRDGEAGAAVLSLVLHHVTSPARVLAEAARVVRPGGLMVVAEYIAHTEEHLRRRHGDHWLGFCPEELEAWLTGAGFAVEQRQHYPLASRLHLFVVQARRLESSTGGEAPKELV